jgi:cytochrome c-type biogenesis protein CcmH/NrfG
VLLEVDPQAALPRLLAAVAANPQNDELWGDLGDARHATGDRAGAREAWERAASIEPGDNEWQRKLAELDPARALADLEARTRESARDDEAWGELGNAYLALGRRAEALATYRHALELDPDDGEWPGKIAALERGE